MARFARESCQSSTVSEGSCEKLMDGNTKVIGWKPASKTAS